MRKQLMLLSALTCLSGGWALLGPAEAQRRYPSCEALVGTSCRASYQPCTNEYGGSDVLYCSPDWGFTWVYA
jgi:hypothetical protein